MSTNTPNYNLVKPDINEFYDVGVQNDNLDAIDQALKDNSDASAANSQTASDNEDAINVLAQAAASNAQAISENSDEIADNAQNISKHEDYAARMLSGIDLSAGDVILPSGDYYKGLLIIAVAHETNALILPSVNNHKFDIYNADTDNDLIVKKAGGNPINIPSGKMYRVAFDGIEYRFNPDVESNVLISKSTAIKAGTADLTLMQWNAATQEWEGSGAGYMVYYDGLLYGNGSMIPLTGHSADDEKTAYSDENGVISKEISNIQVGAFCGGGDYLNVCIQSPQIGVPNVFEDNMITFYGVNGGGSDLWVKSEKPVSADGVQIRVKTSAWQQGDDQTTGTMIADITQDYKNPNEWCKISGLSVSTPYYIKAFPYKGNLFSDEIGQNEFNITLQSGIALWDFDNDVSGVIGDQYNGNDMTKNGLLIAPAKIGNGLHFEWGYLARSYFLPNEFTVITHWRTDNMAASAHGIIGSQAWSGGLAYGWHVEINSSGKLVAGYGKGTASAYYTTEFTAMSPLQQSTDYFLAIRVNVGARNVALWVNNNYIGSFSAGGAMNIAACTEIRVGNWNGATAYQILDQLRIIEGTISDDNLSKFWNGGNLC